MSHQLLGPYTWPLFDVRATLTGQPADRSAVLHVSVDSLICDAYSFGLVMDELAARYRDPAHTRPPLPLTFRDYVQYQLARRDSAGQAAARGLLAGPAGHLAHRAGAAQLRASRARSAGTGSSGGTGGSPPQVWAELKQRATAASLTPSGAAARRVRRGADGRWSRRPHYTINAHRVRPPAGAPAGRRGGRRLHLADRAGGGPRGGRRFPGPGAAAAARGCGRDLDHAAVSGGERDAGAGRWPVAWRRSPSSPVVFTSQPAGERLSRRAAGVPARTGRRRSASSGTPSPRRRRCSSTTRSASRTASCAQLGRGGRRCSRRACSTTCSRPTRRLLDELAGDAQAWSRAGGRSVAARPARARRAQVNDTAAALPDAAACTRPWPSAGGRVTRTRVAGSSTAPCG